MLFVGLTGGIGSGKSTVLDMLESRGAVCIDADDLAREAVAPGTPGLSAIERRFGRDVLAPGGSLDRARLAAVVFADETARRNLEAIVHPEVARLLTERVASLRATERIVVYAVPLLVERGLAPMFDVVVAVSAPEDVRVRRTVAQRGGTDDEVRARIAAQASDAEREAVAQEVLRNDGSREDLVRQVDALWKRLRARMIEPR